MQILFNASVTSARSCSLHCSLSVDAAQHTTSDWQRPTTAQWPHFTASCWPWLPPRRPPWPRPASALRPDSAAAAACSPPARAAAPSAESQRRPGEATGQAPAGHNRRVSVRSAASFLFKTWRRASPGASAAPNERTPSTAPGCCPCVSARRRQCQAPARAQASALRLAARGVERACLPLPHRERARCGRHGLARALRQLAPEALRDLKAL